MLLRILPEILIKNGQADPRPVSHLSRSEKRLVVPTYSPRCPFYENRTSSQGGFCIPYIHLDISQIATKNQTELRSVPASLSSDIADNN